jgi:hypothetical protein
MFIVESLIAELTRKKLPNYQNPDYLIIYWHNKFFCSWTLEKFIIDFPYLLIAVTVIVSPIRP